ncbi:unnamed protein product [Didymodactylos carnosus]|uniref:G-protein coupled receptors family 1 profile domain-containing protein n=1 Tax=Didymodactylos carnosus TaxID=1234261 RepID=A0A8S2ESC8_9BILA|nr:unnamed protein product [Didymodactylos carnosus]CAF1296873.1 unnamed protein product [Didymodactylos carnosus]CAF4102117.1 unnamed protein product [Didymodactylos carnosus]CAF4102131.1 unnamed protein product [Didymodactylos carnosus]
MLTYISRRKMNNQSLTINNDLNNIYVKLNIISGPIIICIGTIGNIFSIYIFSQPSLRSSFSNYSLVLSINNFFVLYFGVLTRWLAHGFNQDLPRYSLFFCRFRTFFSYFIYQFTSFLTLTALIDRWCASSSNRRRQKSVTIRNSYRFIVFIILFLLLIHLHILIYFEIDNYRICRPQIGFYTQFFGIFHLTIAIGFLSLTILFSLLTIINVRKKCYRLRQHRLDNQLILMLFVHVIQYVMLSLPFLLAMVLSALLPSINKNKNFIFIQNLSRITFNTSFCIDFYIDLICARLYRHEFIKLVRRLCPIKKTKVLCGHTVRFNLSENKTFYSSL